MKAAIYARVSTRDKGQDTENQLVALRAYAERLGYTVYKEYVDHESGSKSDRAQFQRLFVDAHQRRYDVLLFWALDRFSREGTVATLTYLGRLAAANVKVKSLQEEWIDSTGIFKEAFIGIMATLAKQERVRQGERTKVGLERAVAKGKSLGRPTVDPELVQQVQRLKATGISDRAIGKALSLSPSTVAKYLKVASPL